MASPVPQTFSEASGSSATPTITEPASAASGDLLVAVVGTADPATAITGLTGWTQLGEGDDGVGNRYWYGWIIRGASAPDLVAAAAATQWVAMCIRIDGHDATTPIGTDHATATGTDTTPDPPNVDPGSSRDHLAITFVVQEGKGDNRFTDTTPSGYTERADIGTAGGGAATAHIGGAMNTRAYTGQAENPGTYTSSVNDGWIAGTIIVRPAAGGGATATPATVSAPVGIPAVAVTASVEKDATTVNSVAAVPLATVFESQTAFPSTVAAVAAIPGVTATASVEKDATTVNAVVAVPSVTVTASAEKTVAALSALTGIPAATVTASVEKAAATVNAVGVIPQATATGDSADATATPATVAAPAAVPAATATASAETTPATVNAASTIPSVTATASVEFSATTVSAIVTIPTAVVTATAEVSVLSVDAVASVALATLIASATTAPATVNAITAVPLPTVTGAFGSGTHQEGGVTVTLQFGATTSSDSSGSLTAGSQS